MLCISAAPLSGAQAELQLRLALTTPRKAPLSGAAEIISFHLRFIKIVFKRLLSEQLYK